MATHTKTLFVFAIILSSLNWISLLHAQAEYDEDTRINSNLAFPITVPAGKTSNFINGGAGATMGVGFNFDRRNAFVGEFMWNWLYPSGESLNPLRAVLQTTDLNGHNNLLVLTGNYRLELRGKRFGTYLIGGAGLYYRNATLSKTVTIPPGTTCTPAWQWWGVPCSSGTLILRDKVSGFSETSPGGNAGIGFTFKVADPRYRMYVEARYHYAPTGNVPVRIIPITTGIRF